MIQILQLFEDKITTAMRVIPRENFLDLEVRHLANTDTPLPIQYEQTTSAPSLIKIVLKAAKLNKNKIVLEVGTGSGWQTALMASMCKHVAAVLYGIGARLDKSPELFFVLRKAEMKDLITKAVHEKSKKMLKKALKKTSRVIDDSDIADIFNIDMEDKVSSASRISRPRTKSLKAKKKNTQKKKKIKIKKE